MVQRRLELKIRAELHLPSKEEFAALDIVILRDPAE
jgi:hypothetical protein